MSPRMCIAVFAVAVIVVSETPSPAVAQRPGLPRGYNLPFFPNMRIPQMNRPRLPNVRNNGNNQKQLSPTELVVKNLEVAQADLEKKNTTDALRQLQGSENILSNLVKNQKKDAKDVETTIDKALKDVRDARVSINSRKLDEATVAIMSAISTLSDKNKNRGEKKKNKD